MKTVQIVALAGIVSLVACGAEKTGSSEDTTASTDATSSSSGTDASSNGDASATTATDTSTIDVDTITPEQTSCVDPGATFTCDNFGPGLTFCIAAAGCNAITACSTGYDCMNQRCVCNDPATCGIACVEGACPCGLVCGPGDRCIEAPPCTFPEQCPVTEVCDHGDCLPREVGSKADGSECSHSDECRGGACIEQTCTQRCDMNAECSNGLVCMRTLDELEGGCALAAVSDCESCTGPTLLCDGFDRECIELCKTNDDCDGRCYGQPRHWAPHPATYAFDRYCDDEASVCHEDEVDIEDEQTMFCSHNDPCVTDVHCNPTYPRCIMYDYSGRGVCVRNP